MKFTKNTPVTDIVLIEPLGPLLGGGFGEMNDSVIVTAVLPLTSEESDNITDVASTANTTPDATPADAVTSAVVCTVMPAGLLASAAAPIVKPLRVMVKAVFAPMVLTAVWMTMVFPEMDDVAVIEPVAPPMLAARVSDGLGVAAKNPAG